MFCVCGLRFDEKEWNNSVWERKIDGRLMVKVIGQERAREKEKNSVKTLRKALGVCLIRGPT